MKTTALEIKKITVSREGREIIRGLDLKLPAGELHALMGPNGSGKSTLANALMGHPKYAVTAGKLALDGRDITKLAADERSLAGLFLSVQNPPEVAGVSVSSFLRAAVNVRRTKPLSVVEFHALLKQKMAGLNMPDSFASRGVNEGFSGGERKRLEMLQLLLLEPRYVLLDEIDSGLDVDTLKIIAATIEALRRAGTGVLLITHSTRLLEYLKPDRVHVLAAGRLVASGGAEIAAQIETAGFEGFTKAPVSGRCKK
ncbi:MAG: Fe-S cluster assembly ATPase SufC [Patescibacteria group bacterium]|jgi:Fe-S cluster assembly ATP-binding protein